VAREGERPTRRAAAAPNAASTSNIDFANDFDGFQITEPSLLDLPPLT
jgi:hypothetical protein